MLQVISAPGKGYDFFHYVVIDGYDPDRNLYRTQFGDGQSRWARLERLEPAWKPTKYATIVIRPADPNAESLRAAVRLEEEGKYALAAQTYREILQKDPKSLLAWTNLGNAEMQLGRPIRGRGGVPQGAGARPRGRRHAEQPGLAAVRAEARRRGRAVRAQGRHDEGPGYVDAARHTGSHPRGAGRIVPRRRRRSGRRWRRCRRSVSRNGRTSRRRVRSPGVLLKARAVVRPPQRADDRAPQTRRAARPHRDESHPRRDSPTRTTNWPRRSRAGHVPRTIPIRADCAPRARRSRRDLGCDRRRSAPHRVDQRGVLVPLQAAHRSG